jgi:hypothetical protein
VERRELGSGQRQLREGKGVSERPGLSRRGHRILVTAIILSPLAALVVLVLVMLQTIEHRAARASGAPDAGAERP